MKFGICTQLEKAGEVKAAVLFDELDEGREFLSLPGFTHVVSPFITNVTKAGGISSSGRIKSTHFV